VLYCSLVFNVAVIEFTFGVLERGMTESEPTVYDMCLICDNAVIFYHMLTGVMARHSRDCLSMLKNGTFLDSRSSTSDLSVVCLPCKVLWSSSELKQ